MAKRVRSVVLCNAENPRPGKGSHTALWAFGYAELAALYRVSIRTARRMVASGEVDPRSLDSVVRCKLVRNARSAVLALRREGATT